MEGSILKSFAILLASVGIVFAVLIVLKKMSKRFTDNTNSVNLKILSKLPLQSKSFLYIVEADGKTLLLGVSEKNINTLAELSDSNKSIAFDDDDSQLLGTANNINPAKKVLDKDLSFFNFLKSSIGVKNNFEKSQTN